MALSHWLLLRLFRPAVLVFTGIAVAVPNVVQNAASNLTAHSETNRSIIPTLFDKDGRVTSEGYRFTTKAYEREAFRLVMEEANKAARDLQLPETLPITEESLTQAFIHGYGQSLAHRGAIGNVVTRDYGYFVSLDHKLCFVEGTHQDRDCWKWVDEYQWPKSRMDTKGAYQLATQWLAAACMDVKALNRDCTVKAKPEPFWNERLSSRKKFVPIYYVYWQSPKNRAEGGSVASVKLFLPTKTLISLRVQDSKYILRSPLVFTNLAVLLSDSTE